MMVSDPNYFIRASIIIVLQLLITTPQLCTSFTTTSTFLPRTPPTTSSRLHSTAESSSFTPSPKYQTDVLVLGSGPAARSIASLLHSSRITTILADKNADRLWPPNYGVWRDEWDTIKSLYSSSSSSIPDLESCIDTEWQVTDCYFGGSFSIPTTQRLRLDRPYCRVDKDALRDALTNGYEIVKANHVSSGIGTTNVYSPPGSLIHTASGSLVTLLGEDDESFVVDAKLVVDCTGHETKLVLKDGRTKSRPPGYQIAYGMLVEVEEDASSSSPAPSSIGPYDKSAMTLFDYRTDHIPDDASAMSSPTFMYCMPLGGNRIFFEETSLVARPAISFEACKERCYKRLEHLGIKVTKVEEEEFCYIPMGGALPEKNQRVVGFGGASAMVHPSTGYHLCRAMMGAGDVAKVIAEEIAKGDENFDPDVAAAKAYHAIWSPDNIRQRNFAVFGGEFLMKQDVEGLRGFFDGFFRLPLELWAGFLAGWPGLPNNVNHETWFGRMWFGLLFITRLPFKVALDMFLNIVSYSVTDWDALPQSVTPFLGEPESYLKGPVRTDVGDVAAKMEARRMIEESKITEVLPVSFGDKKEKKEENDSAADETVMATEESFQ